MCCSVSGSLAAELRAQVSSSHVKYSRELSCSPPPENPVEALRDSGHTYWCAVVEPMRDFVFVAAAGRNADQQLQMGEGRSDGGLW